MLYDPVAVALLVGLAGLLIELLSVLLRNRMVRALGYGTSFILTVFAAVLFVAQDAHIATGLVAFVALYRLVSAARVLTGRMHERRLLTVTRRSTLALAGLQLVAVGLWYGAGRLHWTAWEWLQYLSLAALPVSLLLVLSTYRNLKKSSLRPSDQYTPDGELPTVSVCIPARNETADLPACLESVLASDYPKLEVLVLDDCSQDKTSEIIKGFAQSGVRFIAGEPPRKGWLAKNQAYQQLAEAASGELLLFCGVDVRFDAQAIRSLVGTLKSRRKRMLSVMPQGLQVREHAGLVQPMRYGWELVLPRRLFNRPPVLSSCWMIERKALLELGGFKAVNNAVVPEGYLARELARTDHYSFMRAGPRLSVGTAKRLDAQWQLGVRVRYPQTRKRPENVLLITLAELWFLALPLALFVTGFFIDLEHIWLIAGMTACALLYVHFRVLEAWSPHNYILPLTLLPAAVLTDLLLLHVSMLRYEFGTVQWKDRNICIPVMKTYKKLPDIDRKQNALGYNT